MPDTKIKTKNNAASVSVERAGMQADVSESSQARGWVGGAGGGTHIQDHSNPNGSEIQDHYCQQIV